MPLLRQILALTLVWAILLADFPSRLAERVSTSTSSPQSGRTSRAFRDGLASHLSFPATFAGGSTIPGISPENIPAGQTVSFSGSNFGNSARTVSVASAAVLANNTTWAHPTGSAANASSVPLTAALKTPKARSAGMPPTSDLVAAYSFEEGSGTTTSDSSGNNNTGTLSSGVTRTTGKVGNAVAFDGTSGDITVNEAPSLDLNGSFTLSAWVEPKTVSGSQTLLTKETTAGSCGYFLQIVDGQIDSGFNNGSGCVEHITTNANLSAGNWYHFVAVLDHSSNTYNIYLNGDLISSVAETGVPVPNTQALLLGRSACSACGFERLSGVLDEVNIYDRALSASEVQTLYNAGNPGLTITGLNPTSGAVGTGVTIAGTNFGATQQSSTVTFNGAQGNPTSWSATSIAVQVPSGATSGNVVVTVDGTSSNGVNFSVYSAGSNGLVAAYPFEEGSGTTTADTSGNNNTGTLSSGVTWTAGKIRNGVAFDGTSGDITVNEAPSLDLNGSFTLSAWVKPAALDGYRTLLIKESVVLGCSYFLQIIDGEIDSGFNNGSDCIHHITTNANLSAGNWYHFAAVLDHSSNTYNIYLNGDLISSVAETGVPVPNTQTLLLGRSACSACGFERLNGVLDEVNIYDRALSASEVQTLYNAGTANSANQPPTVSAGANQTIELPVNSATLNGSAYSTVPSGSPVTVQWTQVSGPGSVTFTNSSQVSTQATFPGVGTYVLQLSATVTATGLSNSAQTTVTVAPLNQPPVVSVGPDQTISYPTASANLTGSATDDGYPVGSSLVIYWSKVAGPGLVSFANAAQPNTQASFSLPGNYVLRLSASDGQYTSTATMRVSFIGPVGGPLSVNAGPNQVIVFPTTANLVGTVSDPFLPLGNSLTTQWTQMSGPGTATFANPGSPATSVSFSKAGVYDLRLSAADGVSSGSSDVFIYAGHTTCTRSSKGTDFWVMFLGGFPPSELDISSDVATSGVVNIPGVTFTANFSVVPGQITKLQLPSTSLVTSSDLVETKGVHITALNPVTVVGLNLNPSEPADGFLALPSNTLGTNYAVLSFPNSNYFGPGTGFGITATNDNTTATIVPSVAIGSHQALTPYTITLNQGQTYQLKDETHLSVIPGTQGPSVDLTGTVITSNKPIAVFGSHNCATTPDLCGQLIEQLPPTNLWGQNFVLMPYANELTNSLVHVLASVDGTHVVVNGQTVATLNHGEFTEQVLTGPSVLNADSPVLVAQYGGQGDNFPSMALVPSFDQFGGNYTISSPFNTQSGVSKSDFINVIAPASAATSGGIFLDGNSVSSSAFTPIGASGFSGAQVFVAPGPHTVTGVLPFHITAYGFADDDGYAYPGGMCLATGVAGSTLTLSPKTATNQITSQVTLRAVVNDSSGSPQGGVGVTFQVTGANPSTVTILTDSTGTATYTYRGAATGTDATTAVADTASDTAILTWIGNGPNQAPVVTAGPNLTITLPTSTVTLFGTVVDDGLPVGGGLTSQWSVISGPGQVSFAAPAQPITNASFSVAGIYVLQLSASDSQLSGTATTTVVVNPHNQPPVVSAGPAQTIAFLGVSQTSTTLHGSATDDGLPTGSTLAISWSEVSGPAAVGFLFGQNAPTASVTFSAPGTYIMSLSASDGQFTTTSFATINVVGPPVVTTVSPVEGIVNTAIPVQGTITLNGQPGAGVFTTFWLILSGPSGSQASFANTNATSTTFQANLPGAYQVELCAGNATFCSVETVSVLPVGGANSPTVSFAAPMDGAELTAPTAVTGNVSSGNWVLEYAPQNDLAPQPFITVATGSGAVTAGTLGTFDPTLLLNGQYILRLRTQDNFGLTASATITVSATRNMKVGVFTISFNDLTVPVAGVPIQIIRTYDSRDKSVGDFGLGWHLSLANVRIQKTHSPGLGWTETQQTSGGFPTFCMQAPNPAIVTVVFQDGRAYRFQESLSQSCQGITPLDANTVTFTQLPGPANTSGATLTPADGGSVLVDGSAPGAVTLLGFDGNTYSPTAYVLKTSDGTSYSIDQVLGLTGVTDKNGNTITISANGIIHSSGKSVTFHRDTLGRIVDIFDPNGNVLKYSYDPSGELTGFTDRLNNTYAFSYDSLGVHNLNGILRPDGVNVLQNSYDPSGRLLTTRGADGQTVGFTHDVTNRVETVKDALGHSTTYSYDVDGNVLSVTDPLGHITSSTYDSSDNKLSETNGLGKTSNYTYDPLGNRLTETDPLGHTTTYTYNSLSKPLTVTDANGHSTTNTYDANGNLLTTADPNGKVTTNTYTGKGQLATTKDPLGNTTSFGYDGSGNLTSQTDAAGTLTTYTYDSNGNRNSQAVTRTKSDGTQETLTTQYLYDANSHVTKTTYPDGAFTQVQYDSFGRQSATIDARGKTTRYSYDLTGHLTQTTYPDSSTDQTNYDLNGNRIRSTTRKRYHQLRLRRGEPAHPNARFRAAPTHNPRLRRRRPGTLLEGRERQHHAVCLR